MAEHRRDGPQLEDHRPDEGGLQPPAQIESWLMPYIEEQTLWPVLLVILLHGAAFVVPVLLMAVRDLRTGSIFAIGVLLFLSARVFRYDWRVRRKLGAFSWMVIVIWILSAAGGYLGHRADFL